MAESMPAFRKPGAGERLFNKAFGWMVGLGLGLSYNYLLMVRGRKTGKLYSTPVNLLEFEGKHYLVCPRGRSQWVRNVEVERRAVLRRGTRQTEYLLKMLSDSEKPPILKHYLESYGAVVQRYFPVKAGSPPDAFEPYASRYPVFEAVPSREKP
jgi:deazaflavin-dependent oxidoreductase (nitroreductase family)